MVGKQYTKNEWLDFIEGFDKNKIIKNKNIIKTNLKKTIISSIKKNIPQERFGIMFSGGVDSSLIAFVCKQLKADFVCYSVGFESEHGRRSPDLEYAEKVAEVYGFKIKIKKINLAEAEKIIKKTTKILNEPNVVKVGVGSVVYACGEMANKDNVKYLFSGLGSEEIFAGYQRHAEAEDANEECWKGLKNMWGRDLSRDYLIAGELKLKLLVPFLEEEMIDFAMQIPSQYKINKTDKKIILREAAEEIGLKKEFAWRKKLAAQYGSNFDKAISKLAKKNGFKLKKDYLGSLVRV